MKFARFFRPAHLPAFLIMGLLFYLSNQPSTNIPSLRPPLDKVVHFFAYSTLGASFCLWIRGRRWKEATLRHAGIVLLACALFAFTDEFHQSFIPGRSVSAGDFTADVCGGLLAILIYRITRFYRLADRIHFSVKPFGIRVSAPEK